MTPPDRPHRRRRRLPTAAIAAAGVALGLALAAGGCTSSHSSRWAQTAPAIPPDAETGTPAPETTNLGAWSDGTS
jgi:hypothetical protein